jgi:hypothetical protein
MAADGKAVERLEALDRALDEYATANERKRQLLEGMLQFSMETDLQERDTLDSFIDTVVDWDSMGEDMDLDLDMFGEEEPAAFSLLRDMSEVPNSPVDLDDIDWGIPNLDLAKQIADFRTWSSADGAFSVEAQWAGFKEGKCYLYRQENGQKRTISVEIGSLAKQDQSLLNALKRWSMENRGQLLKQIQIQQLTQSYVDLVRARYEAGSKESLNPKGRLQLFIGKVPKTILFFCCTTNAKKWQRDFSIMPNDSGDFLIGDVNRLGGTDSLGNTEPFGKVDLGFSSGFVEKNTWYQFWPWSSSSTEADDLEIDGWHVRNKAIKEGSLQKGGFYSIKTTIDPLTGITIVKPNSQPEPVSTPPVPYSSDVYIEALRRLEKFSQINAQLHSTFGTDFGWRN